MPSSKTALVWNLPVRLFHWGVVCCFITAWSTLDSRYLDIHIFSGYSTMGLLLFRILWGWLGGPYARFSDFSFTGHEVLSHFKETMKGRPKPFIGHNPAGSWAIYLLIGLSAAITLSGLITLGGEEQHGPLAGLLSFSQGDIAHQIHELLAWSTLAVIAIHISGVLLESRLLNENLIRSMITGKKRIPTTAPPAIAHHNTAITLLVVLSGAALFWFMGYLTAPDDKPYRPFIGPELADNALWREECGSCHLAFHPSLLPARSWQKMLREQATHFEEDLFLEADTINALQIFLTNNAAEWAATEAAWKINHSIAENETPLSITETGYWQEKHGELADAVWQTDPVKGKSDCAACHLDADLGTFEDGAMHLPNNF
ncbi:MAG: cytochrome b/b6 domain-containing protein [Candidatus Polarisedimenticolaceae bacterium]|nr:cytochrome b/b6 domain-containing protein [Candidatus Polarisedimenticolaceae bacterium]